MTTKVEIAVLGLLAEQPMHGYDLLERARARSMGFWTELSRASVYQVLKRLERDGLVAGRAQEGREGPDRRVFRITKAGRTRLAEGAVETAGALVPAETPAGVALGIAHSLPASAARAAAVAPTVKVAAGSVATHHAAGEPHSLAHVQRPQLRRQRAIAVNPAVQHSYLRVQHHGCRPAQGWRRLLRRLPVHDVQT
jgi:DNA-binding PadR family transcriptional regulator